jgi:hypothetical protein
MLVFEDEEFLAGLPISMLKHCLYPPITRRWVHTEKYVRHMWLVFGQFRPQNISSAAHRLSLSAGSVGILSSIILCDISSQLFSAAVYLIKRCIVLTVLVNDSYCLTSYWRNYSNLHHIICSPLVAAMVSSSRHSKVGGLSPGFVHLCISFVRWLQLLCISWAVKELLNPQEELCSIRYI